MADEYQAAKSSKKWWWIIIGVVATAIVGVIIGVCVGGGQEATAQEWKGIICYNGD